MNRTSSNGFSIFLLLLIGSLQSFGQSPTYRFITHKHEMKNGEKFAIDQGVSTIFQMYQEGFGAYFEEDFEIKIRIFEEYYEYKLHQFGYSHATSNAAFYSFKFNEAVVWRRKRGTHLYNDIFHEVNHLLMRNMKTHAQSDFRYRPFWINEGLSEYFETMQLQNGQAWVSPQLSKQQRCKSWGKEGNLGELSEFLSLSYQDLKKTDTKEHRYYARTLAWSLVYFMMSRPDGPQFVGNVLRYLEKNQKAESASVAAIEKFYTGGLKRFEHDWHNWLNQKPSVHLLNGGTVHPIPGNKMALVDRGK